MGNCFGDDSGENMEKTTMGNKSEVISKKERSKPRSKQHKLLLKCKEMQRIPMRLYCEPILNGDDVIFLESSFLSGSTKYSIFDLNEGKMIKTEEIKHDDNDDDDDGDNNNFMFDVFNTEYTLNTDNNTIYFVDNNNNIKILNLDRNKIESLNKRIKTTEDNYVQIVYINKRIYILGAEEITNNDEKGEDRFIVVPYSLAFKQRDSGKKIGLIKKFGQYSRIIATKQDECDYIYIMGGERKYGIKGLNKTEILPNDAMFICKCDGLDGEWSDFYEGRDDEKRNGISSYFTPYPIHSFGIINYKNNYLFQFGGVQFKKDKVTKIDIIYILPLIKNNKYKLEQFNWYEIALKLPQKGHCHAILHNDIMIHLFFYCGKYYTFKIDELFQQLNRGQPEGLFCLQPWSQQGKTVLPTKSKSIKNIGPKEDTEIDEMLENLGKQYEKYQNQMGANCFDSYHDILKDENIDKLKKIITNKQHLTAIIDKAKELKDKQQ